MNDLSVEAIERLNGLGGAAFVQKMIDLFFEFGGTKVTEIAVAVHAGDVEGAGKAAHSLKSSAANVGALEVGRLAAEIEGMARTGETGSLSKLSEELQVAYSEVRPLLEAARTRF